MTRSSAASVSAGRPAQGRPLGMLSAWLGGLARTSNTKAEHWDLFTRQTMLTHQVRLDSRRQLRRQPNGVALESFERVRRDDEPDSEPEALP